MKRILLVVMMLVLFQFLVLDAEIVNDDLHALGTGMVNIAALEITNSVPWSFAISMSSAVLVEYLQKWFKIGTFNKEDIRRGFTGSIISIPITCLMFRKKQSDEEEYRREMYNNRYGTEHPYGSGGRDENPIIIDRRKK